MIFGPTFREAARLDAHLSGGLSRVIIERHVGSGHAPDGGAIEVPTDELPRHLRALGSRFVVALRSVTPEPHDTAAELRAARCLWIEELPAR